MPGKLSGAILCLFFACFLAFGRDRFFNNDTSIDLKRSRDAVKITTGLRISSINV